MTRHRRPGASVTVLVASLVAALVAVASLTGCVRLPESGPVVEEAREVGPRDVPGAFYVPSGPQPGESQLDIVRHFLEAMTATPLQTGVAREFLTEDAAEVWEPERETLTYSGPLAPRGSSRVSLTLPDPNRLDRSGTWRGELSGSASTLSFAMIREDGEWRISDPLDALIVPETWFEDRFRQVSLYFFDPEATILVPEPVFVANGEQLATTLVRRLVEGPGPGLTDVSRTFLPPEASLELSVTVSASGVADVALAGDRAGPDPETASLLLAQLAWTLRQDPTIEAFRVSVAGEPVRLPDGSSEVPVDFGGEFSPSVSASSNRLFGLQDGLVVDVTPGEGTVPVRGPFGTSRLGLSDLAVDMAGDRLAGVAEGGRSVVVGAVDDEDTEIRTVLDGAEDLAKPSWDHAGRLWTLDRTADGARVVVADGGDLQELEVSGVTGQDVVDIAVSRDGSRLAAAVRGPDGDTVVVSRVRYAADGSVSLPVSASDVLRGGDDPLRAVDLAWTSPTTLAVVDRVVPGIWATRSVPVDGSRVSTDDQAPLARDREAVRRVVAGASDDLPTYLVTDSGALPLGGSSAGDEVGPEVTALTYVG